MPYRAGHLVLDTSSWARRAPMMVSQRALRTGRRYALECTVARFGGGRRGRSSMVELQPSKLVMRVRFPSPAQAHWLFSVFCSHMFAIPVFCRAARLAKRCFSSSITILELSYVSVRG